MAAYAFAWMRFQRRRACCSSSIFALQIVPLQMALVPLLQLFSTRLRPMQAWLHDVIPIIPEQNYLPVWIAHTIFALPLAIFLLHNFISEIPADVIEAARVDGASARADLLPDRPAARGSRRSRRSRSSSSSGCGTTCSSR